MHTSPHQHRFIAAKLPTQETVSIRSGSLKISRVLSTFIHVTDIRSFDFSITCNTISHQRLKNKDSIALCETPSFSRNGNCRYKYFVLGHVEAPFLKEHPDSNIIYFKDDIIKMLYF